MSRARRTTLLYLGLTAVLAGYVMVWLPNEAAGLSFIGLEMGEQVKFMARAGRDVPNPNFFYLPPLTLGLLLALAAANWPNRRWQTWAMRGLAVLVALLAFPALETIGGAPVEWLYRLLGIAGVASVAAFSGMVPLPRRALWVGMAVLALVGAVVPTWAYLATRPGVADLLKAPVGVGPGVWVNAAGHVLVAFAAAAGLRAGSGKLNLTI